MTILRSAAAWACYAWGALSVTCLVLSRFRRRTPELPPALPITNECQRVYVIDEDGLRDALKMAHRGDDPEFVLLEIYANSDVEVDPG